MTATTLTPFGPGERAFVFSVALRIVHDVDAAEDIAQEALLLAHRHLATFRGDSRFRTWLYRIAMTTALGHLRRVRRRSEEVMADDLALPDPAKSAEAAVADAEIEELVRKHVARLEPTYRDVLIARADATEIEVAVCLGISVANVKIRAHRARKQLRDALEQELALGVAA